MSLLLLLSGAGMMAQVPSAPSIAQSNQTYLRVSDIQGRQVWQKRLTGQGEHREMVRLPAQSGRLVPAAAGQGDNLFKWQDRVQAGNRCEIESGLISESTAARSIFPGGGGFSS